MISEKYRNYNINDLIELPYFKFSEYRHAPECSGVYFFVYENRIVYIGKTNSIRQRMQSHNFSNRFFKIENKESLDVYFLKEDIENINVIEKSFIEKFKPELNGSAEKIPMSFSNKTPKLIRSLIKFYNKQKINQTQLAEKLGVSPQFLSRCVAGKQNLPLQVVLGIKKSVHGLTYRDTFDYLQRRAGCSR